MSASVIYALWIRQVKRYYRSKTRIIGSLGQPILFLVALGFGFGPIFEAARQKTSYVNFLLPGIIAMGSLFVGLFSGVEIIWDRQFGFLKEIFVAPISRTEIMVGRTLGGATSAFIQGILIFAISIPFDLSILKMVHPVYFFIFMALIAVTFTALGTAIASKLEDMQGFQLIMSLLLMPLFFLSGALFPLENLPPALQFVTSLNPLSYGVDGMRASALGISHFGIYIDFLVLGGFTLIMFIVGTYLFSKIEL
ncbi:MAG: multidrug ABC transporter permease [Candidatus Portnoybacteria bacterium CG10_big_fil_rev_8_21_14_0_10_36_7]|uniref:Transport permease protein n=1 Tax=Candidatus Portnoybacteria bacterium CG10_big_fil_rev_8_21_14_0_10_36_7 TaxID=1974812 RepID=A0A2M8KD68_9BACT|nr:MAG: multidrug ABC transporter permease [Candidatus Portnoybacteria bacterium CG10_big_fil_rev_8_21_14_0_10_36_7]